MAMSPNILVVLGASPEAFYVACGRRHVVENMSPSFTKHANSALSVPATLWISMGRSMEHWVDFNVATEDFHFNANLSQRVIEHLGGTNGKLRAAFIAFPDDTPGDAEARFFVAGKDAGAWFGSMPAYYLQYLNHFQNAMPEVGNSITGMLFGQGNISIYLLSTGYIADLDGDAEADDHLLNKACAEMDGKEWCIERGSTLCFYDSRYFFLKFRRPGTDAVHMKWNLPPAVGAKLADLRQIAEQPEERLAIKAEEEMWARVATQRINAQVASHEQVIASANRALANVFGGVYVERIGYGHRYMGM
ncbi:hypothetical protein FB451DRAFT_617113 [Mycena latifolia]|nr:hypothetical protein FB451DRAFT_617113 [Mycena latifolia]